MKRRFTFLIKDIIKSIDSISKFTVNMNYENFANEMKPGLERILVEVIKEDIQEDLFNE